MKTLLFSPLLLGLAFAFGTPSMDPAGGLQFCRTCEYTDPCTGTVLTASGCCSFPEFPVCAVDFGPGFCVSSVTVGCVDF